VTLYSDIALELPAILPCRVGTDAASRPIHSVPAQCTSCFTRSDHPLRIFFPNLNTDRRATASVYPAFRSFCLDYREDLLRLLKDRRTRR